MRKLGLVMAFLALASSGMAGQVSAGKAGAKPMDGGSTSFTGSITGELSYIPNYDTMGAHENGGRGCAGCHAPHNGARGNGGTTGGYGTYTDAQGGLWGQDTSSIMSNYAAGITFNGNSTNHSSRLTWGAAALNPLTAWSDQTYKGVATCLSCHDGAVSSGAMMSGVSYEQIFGLLNGVAIGLNSNRNSALSGTLYGNNAIPTFLGGSTGAGYNYQHPVGQSANLGAVLGTVLTNSSFGLISGVAGNKITVTGLAPNSPYANFVAVYVPAALLAAVPQSGNAADNFLVCTTCHDPHNMSVAKQVPAGATQVRTVFFVRGGYNPGAPFDPTHEPSTMRFCEQCHFAMSAEYYGAMNMGTAY